MVDKRPSDGKTLLAQLSARMAQCAPQVRSYAICVSQKGINVNRHDCEKHFGDLMICLGKPRRK